MSFHCVGGGGSPTLRSFFTPPSLTLSAATASGSRKPQLTKRVAPASGSRVNARCVFVNNATIRAENVPQRLRTYSSLLNSCYGVPRAKCQVLLPLITYAFCFVYSVVLLVSSITLLFFYLPPIFFPFSRFISIYPLFFSTLFFFLSICRKFSSNSLPSVVPSILSFVLFSSSTSPVHPNISPFPIPLGCYLLPLFSLSFVFLLFLLSFALSSLFNQVCVLLKQVAIFSTNHIILSL